MAAITSLSQDFEGTDGANATTGQLGAASITGGATPTYSGADVQQGNTALRVSTSGNQTNIRWDFTSKTNVWFGFYYKTPSVAPAAAVPIANWFGDANANQIGGLRINADMTISIRDNNTAVYTTPTPIPVNTWMRVAVRAQPDGAGGGVPGSGVHRLRLYVGANRHGATPDFDSNNVSASNSAATNVDTFHLGAMVNGTNTWLFDRLRADDASEPAGLPVSGPPIVNAGPDLTKETGSGAFTITASATGQGGATIASRSWQILSGTTVTLSGTTTDTVTVTAPAVVGSTVLRYTATDNTALSSTDDVTLTWVAPGQTFYPVADVSNAGGWVTNNLTNSALFGTIDDVVLDTSDYVQSPQLGPSGAAVRFRLQSKPAPTNTTGWYLRINKRDLPDNVSSSLIVRLYEADGTTLRKTWSAITTQNPVDTEYQLTLTSGEVSAITSWASGLIVELSATGS